MNPDLDLEYLKKTLLELLNIHSPTGYTDPIVRHVCDELESLKIPYEVTRRGAIRANMNGVRTSPDRAVVVHLDTLGAMVKQLKPNGRLGIVPVGNWSSRFAEGARVSILGDELLHRGTILPLKASGHVYNTEIDTQPVTWDNVEIRVDAPCDNIQDLVDAGFNIGDFVGIDSAPEFLQNDFLNARHLDNKAGVALMLTVMKYISEQEITLPVDCHVLFTISEEVGSGASAGLHGDVAEIVSIDNGTMGPGQNTAEYGATIVLADSTGPFDYHLTHFLRDLCRKHQIPHSRDIFKYYRCDSASAIEAGNDIRTALMAFGVDGSHGYERVHLSSLAAVAQVIFHYVHCDLIYDQPKEATTLKNFPATRRVEMPLDHGGKVEPEIQVPPK